MSIEQTIQILLDRKQKQQKLDTLLPILYRLSDDRFRPSPDDKIVNPISKFKTVAEKRAAYNRDVANNEMAYDDNKEIPLGSDGAKFNDVDYTGGRWHKQKQFDPGDYEMVNIDGKYFILMEKIDIPKTTDFQFYAHANFEFYEAADVWWGLCGLTRDTYFKPQYIVARCTMNQDTFCAQTRKSCVESLMNAGSRLGCKIFNKYYDLIATEFNKSKEPTK